MSELAVYELERNFKANKDLVWKVWTEPEFVRRWYGPGVETIIHEFDLRAGGVWRNEMRWPDKSGKTMSDFSKMSFKNVEKGEKIVWHHASVDQNWNIASNQMMPDWPKLLQTTVTFEDIKTIGEPSTTVHLRQVPIDANEKEIACFTNMMAGMSKGWAAGYNIIDEILSQLQT